MANHDDLHCIVPNLLIRHIYCTCSHEIAYLTKYQKLVIRQLMAGVHRIFTRQFGVRTSGTFFFPPRVLFRSSRSNIHNRIMTDVSVVRHNARSRGSSLPLLFTATGVAGVGLGLSAFNSPTIYCDGGLTNFITFFLLTLCLYRSL